MSFWPERLRAVEAQYNLEREEWMRERAHFLAALSSVSPVSVEGEGEKAAEDEKTATVNWPQPPGQDYSTAAPCSLSAPVPSREPTEGEGDTPGCNCASRGMLEGTRHGLACPYGKAQAKAWMDEQAEKRAATPPVEDMTCEEALAEAQAVAALWQRRAVELGYGSPSREPTPSEIEAAAAALWEAIHNLPAGSYATTREKEKARYRLRARVALLAARSASTGEGP